MSETRLWLRLKSGDHAALKEIYEAHIDFLLSYGTRFAPDPTIVEDGVHDLFVYLWQNRKTIGVTDKIRPYLTTALRRRILKNIKNLSIESNVKSDDNLWFRAEPAIEEQLINEEISLEKRKRLSQALISLSDKEKEVLLLKYQSNMDYEDICNVMGISYQSVRNLVSRAIKKLRTSLELLTGIIFLLVQ